MKFSGELYSWGKGWHGGLGHGDSEDQTKPKLVEALLGYRVIDVAWGSGKSLICLYLVIFFEKNHIYFSFLFFIFGKHRNGFYFSCFFLKK